MEYNLSSILYPQLQDITKIALMHPIKCYGDDDNKEAVDRFFSFSFASCCNAAMDPEWELPYGKGQEMGPYLEVFREMGIDVRKPETTFEPCPRFIIRLDNLSYSIRLNQYDLMVKIDGNECPGWSFYIRTSPERFAAMIVEFDSLYGWLMDSYKFYVDVIHKQKIIDEIETVTREAKSSRRRWW